MINVFVKHSYNVIIIRNYATIMTNTNANISRSTSFQAMVMASYRRETLISLLGMRLKYILLGLGKSSSTEEFVYSTL